MKNLYYPLAAVLLGTAVFFGFRSQQTPDASRPVAANIDGAGAENAPVAPVASAAPALPKLNPVRDISLAEFRRELPAPGRDFSTGPLWVWNDRLTEEQVRSTIRDLASQQVKQVWVHPRPGLMTPYLSPEWFALWKVALDEAKKLDMNVWIYDENSYPSGFAGGLVGEKMPEARGQSLVLSVGKDGKLQKRISLAGASGWYAGKWHVDLLKTGVTKTFLDITLDGYKNVPEIAAEFGKRVPGIFTDEPHPMGLHFGNGRASIPWNDEFEGEFKKRFGYSLEENLSLLVKTDGDWKRVRHNYHQLVLDLFIDRFAKPYSERCEKYGLQLTGHVWEHGWPGTGNGPDNMAFYFWAQRPAIDLLMNTYNDNSAGAQFGNVRSVKELASVANQTGHSRTLSENYGAGGWDLRFEDMKRLGDWSYALGVNTTNEHLSYVTIRGARKRDHPQSFSYHSPWFGGYHVVAKHLTRLSYALSQGRQINKILVIEPTTTAWLYQGRGELGGIAKTFTALVNALEHKQVEYDLGSEDILRRIGSVTGGELRVGHASYDIVVLPQYFENINAPTLKLLKEFTANGGTLLTLSKPSLIDGKTVPQNEVEITGANVREVSFDDVVAAGVERTKKTNLLVTVPDGTRSIFHHRRKLADAEVLFISNASLQDAVEVKIETPLNIAPVIDGVVQNSAASAKTITLPPAGDALFVLTKNAITDGGKTPFAFAENTAGGTAGAGAETVLAGSDVTAARPAENVLVLDYVDVTAGGETHTNIYTWDANRFVFQKHGFSSGNPWDNQVQFRDELIKKQFPADSGFTAEYRFILGKEIPKNLSVVIERGDLYEITLNEQPIAPVPGAWWLDRAFTKIPVAGVAKTGTNYLKIKAKRFQIEHEIEPAYLLGDFALESAASGFVVVPAEPLKTLPAASATKVAGTTKNESESAAKKAVVETHGDALEGISWLSAGVGFRDVGPKKNDPAPELVFEVGGEREIAGVRIWNYSERNLTSRGVKEVKITAAGADGKPVFEQTFSLKTAGGDAEVLTFSKPVKANKVRFQILSNRAGVKYPLAAGATPADNGFVGLSEVRFLDKDGAALAGVSVSATSELRGGSFDRSAKHLVDGSGLDDNSADAATGAGTGTAGALAWNAQGLPFYSGKIAYTRTYANVRKTAANAGPGNANNNAAGGARFYVRLPVSPTGWYGATAEVFVNGKSAGYLLSAPWETDVTDLLRDGENNVTIEVYGTPKNLFGPHHIGRHRGSAWPGQFRRAPRHLPAGTRYDTIAYGLFTPFELVQR